MTTHAGDFLSVPATISPRWREVRPPFGTLSPAPSIEEVEQHAAEFGLTYFRLTSKKLPTRVRTALANSDADWRSVASLAQQLEVDETSVRDAVRVLGDAVRAPVRPRRGEEEWLRLSSLGYTWQEKIRIALSIIARRPR
ncbi:hypothetical protein [Aeromicrobium sp. Leaf289]|uniref:hypothetical protein n=1 Tax=Aeromicrobium sp. Leaf289 TaxID=1736324 RepID=UPI0012E17C42|nr:hypothetical protein [Aeromicrobium sp. Leaf289]